MKRAICFTGDKTPTGGLTKALWKQAPKMGIDVIQSTKKIRLFDYDQAVYFNNRPDNIVNLEKDDCKVGWWMCDLRTPYKLPNLPKEIDHIFICNTQYLKDYYYKYKLPVDYVPQCGLDEKIKKGREIKADAVFIGSILSGEYHGNRYPILEEIAKKHKVMIVHKERWTKDSKWIYRHTPISLAISPQIKGYTSNRLYNILASKGFCLTLYFPGIEDLFENKKHLVWFNDVEEAVELIDYYKNHKKERDYIAEQGFKEYQRRHTAKHRLQTIFNLL